MFTRKMAIRVVMMVERGIKHLRLNAVLSINSTVFISHHFCCVCGLRFPDEFFKYLQTQPRFLVPAGMISPENTNAVI